MRNDITQYNDKNFNLLILDEAQFIKNAFAKKTLSVKNIKANSKFVLTGTPIENSILDLWSIFDFIMPGFLPPLRKFKNDYENDSNYFSAIRRKISPFILRRNKKDVLNDLPEKYEILLTTKMEKEQEKIYEMEKLKAKEILKSSPSSFEILPFLMKLRQICIHPSLYIENYQGESGKINALLNTIDDELTKRN